MQIERPKRFQKAYRKLESLNQQSVDRALKRFMSNPLHPSLRTEKVQGTPNKWSFRASDSLRCTFEFAGSLQELRNAQVVSLSNVDNQHDVYKKP